MLLGELRGLGGKYFRHRDPGRAITPRTELAHKPRTTFGRLL
jgi:hypothetical protein